MSDVNEHVQTFGGLPVVPWNAEPEDPAAVCWRLDLAGFKWPDYYEREIGTYDPDIDLVHDELTARFERLLDRAGNGGPVALVLGEWGTYYERGLPLDLLLDNAARMPRLRSLFLGDIAPEESDISMIELGTLNPVLDAFPALERLWVRGSQYLEVEPFRHEALRELVFQSGGLPAEVVRGVAAADLPMLEHLELWLGVSDYFGDAQVDDLAPILTGRALPALTSLGLRNAEIADEVATAVAAAPVVARLRRLDLSDGMLSDAGGEALLTGQPLTHLESLDLHHHFLSKELARRFADELPGVRVDVSERQREEDGERYTAVGE